MQFIPRTRRSWSLPIFVAFPLNLLRSVYFMPQLNVVAETWVIIVWHSILHDTRILHLEDICLFPFMQDEASSGKQYFEFSASPYDMYRAVHKPRKLARSTENDSLTSSWRTKLRSLALPLIAGIGLMWCINHCLGRCHCQCGDRGAEQ